MAIRTQLKLLLFLTVVGIAAGTIAAAVWAYKNVIQHDSSIAQEIKTMNTPGRPAADPGVHHFKTAVELIRSGKLDAGKDGLYKLLRQFPRSPTTGEAKRIIGEMNLDDLYAADMTGDKRDYIVQPGDNLSAIAVKHRTTLDAIARVNGLTSMTRLQPGDHLFLIPMNFDLVVDASSKLITIMREGRFFREYQAMELKLRPGTKIPATLEVTAKSAINRTDGKAADPASVSYLDAEKRVVLSYKGSTTGSAALLITTPGLAKALAVTDPSKPPTPAPASDEPDTTTGLFVAQDDLEEIYPLLRRGSAVTIVE
jgi:LysM repeat protein